MTNPRFCHLLVPLALLAPSLLLAGNPQRVLLSTADGGWGADAMVSGSKTHTARPIGDGPWLGPKDAGARRKVYLRFDLKDVPRDRIAAARLKLTIAEMDLTDGGLSAGLGYRVFGLNDGVRPGSDGRLGEDWPEAAITYDNAPANVHDERTVSVGAGVDRGGQARTLGESVLQGSLFSVGQSFTMLDSSGDPRVLDFLRADTNGHVTFIITRVQGSSANTLTFAARENPRGLPAPKLEIDLLP
jgi:hypothetical protein